jgi:NAD(P)-dependent dehydrogenase (short-subunit alcohol dehydrogenase family)
VTQERLGTAIVTGGARGIGYEIAAHLRAAGHSLVLVDRDAPALDEAAAQLESVDPPSGSDARIAVSAGDVTDEQCAAGAVEVTAATGRPLSVLVNNAGIGRLSPLIDMSVDDWDAVVDVSLKGTFLFTRSFARHVVAEGGGGCIVNISSLNALAATDGFGHYCAAKAGVSMLTQVAASELGSAGIRVNAVAPGKTVVPVTHDAAAGFRVASPRSEQEFLRRTPLGRLGRPADIAAAVLFLTSTDASWVTGVTLPVDGGNHVRGLHSYWAVYEEDRAAREHPLT